VLFTADSGMLSGHIFLVVEENGIVSYYAGADPVIELSGATGRCRQSSARRASDWHVTVP
jgi:hypothetical protein